MDLYNGDKNRNEHYKEKTKTKIKRNPKTPKFIVFLISLICICLVLILSYNFLLLINNILGEPFSRYGFDKNAHVVSYKTIYPGIKEEGLLLKEEKLYFANEEGKVNLLKDDLSRINHGNEILQIIEPKSNEIIKRYHNYDTGLLSYKVDGLENTLNFNIINKMTYDMYSSFKNKTFRVENGENINLGRPLYKVVDNSAFKIIVPLDYKNSLFYGVGDRVDLFFYENEDIGQEKFSGRIEKIISDKKYSLMVINSNRFLNELSYLRRLKVEVKGQSYEGLSIPNELIKEKDGKQKVLVNGLLFDNYREIEILAKTNKNSIIKGVGVGTRLLPIN